MAEQRNRTPDVAPGMEQLANIDASKLAKETPRSRLLADIDASLREFEGNPKKHQEQIEELRDMASELTDGANQKRYESDPGAGEEAMRETEARIADIKKEALAEIRGGNGSGAPEEPMSEPASAEAGPHPLWEKLTQTITEVAGRVATLDDEQKKAALKNQLELLQAYQRIKPKPEDRNSLWEQRVRKTLARIRSIERPKRERPVRERRVPKPEAADREAAEPDTEQRIQELAQQLRIEREAGGTEANKELDERIRTAGARPFTSEADAIAREYDLERARLALQEKAVAPAEAGPEVPEILPEAKALVITRAQEALVIIGRKIGTGKSSHIGRALEFNIEQAQEKLASALVSGISESGLERVQAITEKLQVLAAGWERDKRKNWEKEVQQRSFELANALTHAMPAEHRPAVVPAHGSRTEAFVAQPEAIPDAGAEAEEHAQAASERHARDDFSYLNRTLELSLDSRKDNTRVLREQAKNLGMAFADSVSQQQMARQLREKIEFEGAPRRTAGQKIFAEEAGMYDPEQEVGAPQEPERAASADEAGRKERVHAELVEQKKELDSLVARYEATADQKEKQELGEEIKAKGKDFFEKLEAFENLDKKV